MTRFLVVGTGRCGTRFTANVLQAAGVNCGHEAVYSLRVGTGNAPVRWGDYQADSSWVAVPHLHYANLPTVLVARHPLGVVKSMLELGWFSQRKRLSTTRIAHSFRPEIQYENSRQNKCLALWYHWNMTALVNTDLVLNIDHFDHHALGHFVEIITGDPVNITKQHLADVGADPIRSNRKLDPQRESWNISWESFRPALAIAARDLWSTLENKLGMMQ